MIRYTSRSMNVLARAATSVKPHRLWAFLHPGRIGSPVEAALRMRAERLGITVMETTRDRATAQVMAIAMSPKSCPTSSWMKTTGTNTAMVVRVLARTAPHTSVAPS